MAPSHGMNAGHGQRKIIFIEDDEINRIVFSRTLKRLHPNMTGIVCTSLTEAERALKEHPDANAVVSDAVLKTDYGRHGSVPEFLKWVEENHPRTHLAFYTGLDASRFDPKGIRVYAKASDNEKFWEFVKGLDSSPYRKPPEGAEKINLREFAQPLMHTTASGKKELVKLVKSAQESGDKKKILEMKAELDRMRQGWKPPQMRPRREAIERLNEALRSETLTQKEVNRLWDSLSALKKKK